MQPLVHLTTQWSEAYRINNSGVLSLNSTYAGPSTNGSQELINQNAGSNYGY